MEKSQIAEGATNSDDIQNVSGHRSRSSLGRNEASRELHKQPFVGVNSEEARRGRLEFLKTLGLEVALYEESGLNTQEVKGNIESFLGSMTLPVGLVGPLLYAKGAGDLEEVFVPAATTEGALVASMNRGVSVLNQSGGFRAHVEWQRMLRAPMFCFQHLDDALRFRRWIERQFDVLVSYLRQYSTHTILVEIKTELMGKNLMCQFYFETGDAAGQNMTTICTWKACAYLERVYERECPGSITDFILDCNGSGDKKLSYDSMLNGRGINVVAECIVTEEVLRRKLKTSSAMMMSWYTRSTHVAHSGGMIGYNVNVANVVASVFAATGQDLACVHESSVAYLYFEPHETGLYVCLKLPRLVVATVGGGTSLPYQRENLALMGCSGSGKVKRFAEILAGLCLGLELSTFAAMANGQFAIAHERLGRNKPLRNLAEKSSLETVLSERLLKDKTQALRWVGRLNESNGILTEITSQTTAKELGLSVWEVSKAQTRRLALLKSKPTDSELLNCMYVLTGLIDPGLAQVFDGYKDRSDFRYAHLKETAIYRSATSKHMPHVYGTLCDEPSESYLIMMEQLERSDYRLMNSEMNPELWNFQDVKAIINVALSLHESLRGFVDDPMFAWSSVDDYLLFSRRALSVLRDEYGVEWAPFLGLYDSALKFLGSVDEAELPKTVVHNDFNPRNIAISHRGDAVVYDFELARVDVPHRDLVEFLSFVYSGADERLNLAELMTLFGDAMGEDLSQTTHHMKFALAKYVATRMSLYLLGHRITQYPFLRQVSDNCVRLGRELGLL